LLIEKIPHFALAIGFGIRSILDQHTFGALDTKGEAYTFIERIPLGCYAFITYLWKAIAPVGLSCFYPYPPKPNGSLSAEYYIYPAVVIAVIFIVWRFLRKNKVVMFGLLFFLVNIALLLQFIPVGGAIIADRYSYIPYIGLFFIPGWYISGLFLPGGKKQYAYPALAISLLYVLFLGYLSNERCKAWYDTISLWRDEMEKEPLTYNSYNNLGSEYSGKFNTSVNQNEKKVYFDSAYYFLNKTIELQPDFVNAYVLLGELMREANQFPEAKKYYSKALSLKTSDKTPEAYLGLAIIYAISRNFDSSAFCFRQAIQLKPYFPEAHSNYGNFLDMTGRRDSAVVQYGIAISQNPDVDAFYLNRGRAYTQLNLWNEAMKDFEKAIALNPNLGDNYYARSHCYAHAGNKSLALQDVQKAISLGCTQVDKTYYESLQH
jgi:tetratricopeptide (TPR) repeat protein